MTNCKSEPQREPRVINLSANRRSIKQQGYVAGYVNGISTLLLINTGADISLMSTAIYDQITEKRELREDSIDLFSANGTLLSSIGTSDLFIKLDNRVFKRSVVLVDNFSYYFILGKDFFVAYEATIDFRNSALVLPDVIIKFTSPKRKFIVTTVSDIRISAKTTVAVQTKRPD